METDGVAYKQGMTVSRNGQQKSVLGYRCSYFRLLSIRRIVEVESAQLSKSFQARDVQAYCVVSNRSPLWNVDTTIL